MTEQPQDVEPVVSVRDRKRGFAGDDAGPVNRALPAEPVPDSAGQ